MTQLHNVFKTTRLSIWLIVCALILAATSVYAAGDQRPLAAVDIIGSPDAAVDGQFAVGTATPGNKALTVAGVIDFVGAGAVHNYFTQGPGNNMQVRSNVDEYNAVGNSSYAQWNMVMGASLDVFSIRRSPASSTYNEDALFWIEGDTGNIGISKVDTSNGATIPFSLQARLHVETDSGDAIRAISNATAGSAYGVTGLSASTEGSGLRGWATAATGITYGVEGGSNSSEGRGVMGWATATSGYTYGVYGRSDSTSGRGVFGYVGSSSGSTYGVFGLSYSNDGIGVYGRVDASNGVTYGVYGRSSSTEGRAVYGYADAGSGVTYGVWGNSDSTEGRGVLGRVTATSGTTYGVIGVSFSTDGRGVSGEAIAATGATYGVYGQSDSTEGVGIYGYSTASTGTTYGIYGKSSSTAIGATGVYGTTNNTTSSLVFGVRGESGGTNGVGVQGTSDGSNGVGVRGIANATSGFDFYASGAGTDYGPFTGAHEVLLSGSFPTEIKPGMIVSGTGEAHFRLSEDGSVDLSSTLPTVKLADSAEDNAVLGVIVAKITLPEDHWYAAQDGQRFASVNALGEGRVWVTNMNGDVKVGDYITTSSIPGYGQTQVDHILRGYTLAKAMETVDWDTVTDTVTFNGQEYKVYLLAVVYTSG